MLEPVNIDLAIITKIYLKYHGFKFASMFTNFDLDLYLAFTENAAEPSKQIISHSVLLPSPVHSADIRFTLIPELLRIFSNHQITHGERILPNLRQIYQKLQNAY